MPKFVPFHKVRGIRRRWILNSLSVLLVILTAVVIGFAVMIQNYFYGSVTNSIEIKARAASGYFSSYADKDYLTTVENYISSFEDSGTIELQFLTMGGRVLFSSNGLTLAGSMPNTADVSQIQNHADDIRSWRGVSPETGEKIIAVSAPLVLDGSTVGIMRYVTSARIIDHEIITMTACVLLVAIVIFLLVYVSNRFFVSSIVEPVDNITDIAQRIAGGSYGIQVEKKFDDEIGDLTDAINDMSLRIKQMEKMKTEFISSVSHELRTPLTAITGWAETIMTGEARSPEDIRKGMGIIASEARRLSGMVEELLEFSRIEDGHFALFIEPMDIKAELEDAVYTYHEFLATKGITVNHTDCEEEFAPISGDPSRLRQVFCNLLDNASKHGGSGKRIDTAIFPEGEEIVITVRDYGPGIPPEELPNVKLKFYKGSSTARGSGIGLALCEEFVARHNGTLDIRNADDGEGGCLVEVRLPKGT